MISITRHAAYIASIALLAYGTLVHAQDQFLDVDGLKLRYVDRGEGMPVLLVHGFSLSVESNWDAPGITRTLLDAGYRVVAFDNRGHGRSSKPYDPNKYGMEMVYDIGRVLDHLGIEQAHIVGYSQGARLVNKFLTLQPERFRSAILGGYGWGHSGQFRTAEAIEELLASGRIAGPNDAKALIATLARAPDYGVDEQSLGENQIPVLALIGDDDARRPFAEAMSGVMPNLDVKVVPGNHLSVLQNPLFAQEIESYLEKQH